MPKIYFRFCFLAVHTPYTDRTAVHTHAARHVERCVTLKAHSNSKAHLLYKTGPSSTNFTWFVDNKINCHAIVQPIFMKFTGIVGYGSPNNLI